MAERDRAVEAERQAMGAKRLAEQRLTEAIKARTAQSEQRQIAEAERDRSMEAERQAREAKRQAMEAEQLAEQRRAEAEAARMAEAEQRQKAEQQAKISQAVADFLNNMLAKAKGRDVTVRKVLDAASENIKGKFEGEPLLEASIRTTLGYTYLSLGDYQAAEPHLVRARDIHREELGEEDPFTLASTSNLGWLYLLQARYDGAESRCSVKRWRSGVACWARNIHPL